MLQAYLEPPFDQSTLIDKLDFFTGDGVTKTFTLKNKTGYRVGEVVQVGSTMLHRSQGGFTVNGNLITLAITPGFGTIVTVPGVNAIQFVAYDQNVVTGDASPRTKRASFYLVDIDTINWLLHHEAPSLPGIRISITDHDTSFGASSSWFRLAKAIGSGGPDTFGSYGAPLYIPEISAVDSLQADTDILDTLITVSDGSAFTVGDVLAIDWGNSTIDVATIEGISGNDLTVSPLDQAHNTGAVVYVIGRKIWIEGTVPTNVANNEPIAFFETSIDVYAVSESRSGLELSAQTPTGGCCPLNVTSINGSGNLIIGLNRVTLAGLDSTVILPDAEANTGETVVVKRLDANASILSVETTLGQTIDGAASFQINGQYKSYTFVSDGNNWLIT